MLSIQKQMDETIKNINALLKNVQLELNFDRPEEKDVKQEDTISDATRGSKRFIEQMKKQLDNEGNLTIKVVFVVEKNIVSDNPIQY